MFILNICITFAHDMTPKMYAIVDELGYILQEEDLYCKILKQAKLLAVNVKEPLSIYKRVADINYKAVLEVKEYGN